jgi:hypothetical protein
MQNSPSFAYALTQTDAPLHSSFSGRRDRPGSAAAPRSVEIAGLPYEMMRENKEKK